MRMLGRLVAVLCVAFGAPGASTGAEPDLGATVESVGASDVLVSQAQSCEGLLRARENCPDEQACATLQEQIDQHGCAPAAPECPCTSDPYPVGQIYCSGDGNPVTGVFFCWSSVTPPSPNHCEVHGGDYTPEEKQAICEACRVEYADVYAACVAAGG